MPYLTGKEAQYVESSMPNRFYSSERSRSDLLATLNRLTPSSSSKYAKNVLGEWKRLTDSLFHINQSREVERGLGIARRFAVKRQKNAGDHKTK